MLRVATPGVPKTTPGAGGTVEGIKYAASLGIVAMEMEWVQMVPTNVNRMVEIRKTAEELNVVLTVHAPYFVNLNSQDAAKLQASKQRILAALSMAEIAGAISVCVHPAFYQGIEPAIVYEQVRRATDEIMKHKEKSFPHVNLAYETMGKPSQFGTLDEVLVLSKEFGLYPCVDPAHMHARSNGAVNTYEEWDAMLDVYSEYLGKHSLNNMHLHFSGIAYGAKGEKHHLPLQESDARWEDFLRVLHDRNVGGVLVCESPLMEMDTMLLQKTLREM